jgi:hypothetical protein
VVRGDDHDRLVEQAAALEVGEQLAELAVQPVQLGVVAVDLVGQLVDLRVEARAVAVGRGLDDRVDRLQLPGREDLLRAALPRTVGRRVGVVRVEVVQPEEERGGRRPCRGTRGRGG